MLLAGAVSAWAEGLLTGAATALATSQFIYRAPVVVDTQVSAVPGFLHCISIAQNDAAPTAGSIVVYDNTAESGTQIFNWTLTTAVFTPFQYCPDARLTTGLYIGFTTTGDVNVAVSYR
jgi:hypothetical protein